MLCNYIVSNVSKNVQTQRNLLKVNNVFNVCHHKKHQIIEWRNVFLFEKNKNKTTINTKNPKCVWLHVLMNLIQTPVLFSLSQSTLRGHCKATWTNSFENEGPRRSGNSQDHCGYLAKPHLWQIYISGSILRWLDHFFLPKIWKLFMFHEQFI